MHIIFYVQIVHQFHIYSNEDNENYLRTLICKPEAQGEPCKFYAVKLVCHYNPEQIRYCKPYRKQNDYIKLVLPPICLISLYISHN